jgi:hypothetical protein
MSTVVTNNIVGPIEFTTGGQTTFLGVTFATPLLFGPRVGIGFSELVGYIKATAAVPGLAPGTLFIEQSVDGTNYDLVDTFPVTVAGGTVPFARKIVARFIRARFTVPIGEVYDIRFGAHLNPISSP